MLKRESGPTHRGMETVSGSGGGGDHQRAASKANKRSTEGLGDSQTTQEGEGRRQTSTKQVPLCARVEDHRQRWSMLGCEGDELHVGVIGSGGGGDRRLLRMVIGKVGQYRFVVNKSWVGTPSPLKRLVVGR